MGKTIVLLIALTGCATHDPCENPDTYYSGAFSCGKPEPAGCEHPTFDEVRGIPGYYAIITEGVTLECDTRPK